ncbi:MAG: DUF2959 domain-containing protein [Woeseia sp.]|nr:DUF2959 domain-containing protein [Woeseia sp.]
MNAKIFSSHLRVFQLVVVAMLMGGCATAYYNTLEKFGIEKRDILVSRIDDAQEAQGDAKEQFSSALERYRSVINVDGGDIEEIYDALNGDFERSTSRAEEVRERINEVEEVAEDLFEEWQEEIALYSDANLRRQSQVLYRETQRDYEELSRAMRRAEAKMEPVLTLFQDQVLFLRHNLNARAIGALEAELGSIEKATQSLIEEMERSIAEANEFVASMS